MPDVDRENARQGRSGVPVLLVLIVALSLAVVIWLALGVYNWMLPDAPPTAVSPGASPAANASTAPADAAPVTVSSQAGIERASPDRPASN